MDEEGDRPQPPGAHYRSALHERGLHTEAMVMGCAASTIKILRGQISEKMPKRRA